jgi:glucan 1,3-beta-glucosidase
MEPSFNTLLNDNAVNAPYYGAIVDEYTAGLYSDKDFLTQTLNDHFATWITEDDFKQMAAAGLNHARLPIPYWAFPDLIGSAPYVAGNRFDVLKQACGWAKNHGVKVWIDLHGVPGSQ